MHTNGGAADADVLPVDQLDRLISLEAKLQRATSARERQGDQAMEKPRCMVERGRHPYEVSSGPSSRSLENTRSE